MKNLIFNALAFQEGYETSPQIKNIKKKMDIYIKNSFVSLVSCKINNPEAKVCLFSNIDLSNNYKKLFEENGIEVKKISFNEFVLPKEFQWGLAFFKLNCLKYAVEELEYDNYLMLDTDTFTVKSLNELWDECKNGILLYDLDHRLEHPHRKEIYENWSKFNSEYIKINQYGGELIAGNRELLKIFCSKLVNIYEEVKVCTNLDKTLGDEFLVSIAANYIKSDIVRANKYIYRYWTGRFYLVSTNYIHNSVDIWHLPQEKESGMLWLYRYYISNNKFPSLKKTARRLGLPKSKPSVNKLLKILIKKYI